MINVRYWIIAVMLLCPLATYAQNPYQLHNDGEIWRYTGLPCSGELLSWLAKTRQQS